MEIKKVWNEKPTTKVEEIARKKGYVAHYNTIYGVYQGALEDIEFQVSIYEQTKQINVELDIEEWERIPNRAYLQEIINAYEYGETIGKEILGELENDIRRKNI